MKKLSMMGCSKYEFNPSQFDKDIKAKMEFKESTVKEVEELIMKRSMEYQNQKIGYADLFREDVLRTLLKNHLDKQV